MYIYIKKNIYICSPPPPGPTFLDFIDLFHCKVNHLLLESLLPSPHPKVGHPIFFLFLFLLFWFCSRIWSLELLQINPSQIWFIWPLRHHVSIKCILHNHNQKSIVCFKHAQVFLGDVQFSFQVWGLWECTILLAVSGAFLSNKWSCCLNRGQLGFFERSVAYVQTN